MPWPTGSPRQAAPCRHHWRRITLPLHPHGRRAGAPADRPPRGRRGGGQPSRALTAARTPVPCVISPRRRWRTQRYEVRVPGWPPVIRRRLRWRRCPAADGSTALHRPAQRRCAASGAGQAGKAPGVPPDQESTSGSRSDSCRIVASGSTGPDGTSSARQQHRAHPMLFAPEMSSIGRSPTKHGLGADRRTASALPPAPPGTPPGAASGGRDRSCRPGRRAARAHRRAPSQRSCQSRGQWVFDSSPVRIPRSRRARTAARPAGR